jgi:hypothetical protein
MRQVTQSRETARKTTAPTPQTQFFDQPKIIQLEMQLEMRTMHCKLHPLSQNQAQGCASAADFTVPHSNVRSDQSQRTS